MSSLLPKLAALETDLNGSVFERADEVRGLVVGLVAGKHAFYLGVPGVAKSMLVNRLTARITGAVMFDRLLMRTSKPEELFGPLNLAALGQGRYESVISGMLPEAHFAFLDEIWKCNSAVLNTLLGVLNERTYRQGNRAIKCPLLTCVAASNELPQGEDLNAMWDRLHLRYVVHPIAEDANFRSMLLLRGAAPPAATLSLDEIYAAQKDRDAIKVGAGALDTYSKIRMGCEREGIRVSDRKWHESVSIVQAEAMLNGHDEIEAGDFGILRHVLWNAPEERKKVIDLVYAVSCPALPRALEIVDLVADQHKKAKQDRKQAGNSFEAIAELSDEIDALVTGNGSTGAARDLKAAHDKVRRMRAEVGELLVGKVK